MMGGKMGKIEVVLGGGRPDKDRSEDGDEDVFAVAAADMISAIKDDDAETLAAILRSLPDLGG